MKRNVLASANDTAGPTLIQILNKKKTPPVFLETFLSAVCLKSLTMARVMILRGKESLMGFESTTGG